MTQRLRSSARRMRRRWRRASPDSGRWPESVKVASGSQTRLTIVAQGHEIDRANLLVALDRHLGIWSGA